jgi:NADPH2:quinone reductase
MSTSSSPSITTARHFVTPSGDGGVLVARELPDPGTGELRIRVAAASVNPADVATRDGVFHAVGFIPAGQSAGLGWDLAGTVEAVGESVGEFAVGDAVIGIRDDFAAPIGAQGEALVLPVRAVGHAPRGVEPVAAATIALNALTAHQALDLLGLAEGEMVLITGAAGAVGGFAVELAKVRGLRVVAQASDRDHDWLRSIGADAVIGRDGRPDRPVDGVLDAATLGAPALAAARDGGAYVTVLDPAPQAERDIRVDVVHVHAKAGQLDDLSRLVEQGRLTLRVAETIPLAQADEAYAKVAAGGLRGRVVLTMD